MYVCVCVVFFFSSGFWGGEEDATQKKKKKKAPSSFVSFALLTRLFAVDAFFFFPYSAV